MDPLVNKSSATIKTPTGYIIFHQMTMIGHQPIVATAIIIQNVHTNKKMAGRFSGDILKVLKNTNGLQVTSLGGPPFNKTINLHIQKDVSSGTITFVMTDGVDTVTAIVPSSALKARAKSTEHFSVMGRTITNMDFIILVILGLLLGYIIYKKKGKLF